MQVVISVFTCCKYMEPSVLFLWQLDKIKTHFSGMKTLKTGHICSTDRGGMFRAKQPHNTANALTFETFNLQKKLPDLRTFFFYYRLIN